MAKAAVAARRQGRQARSVGIDRAKAERMAADLDGYDSQIKGGRLMQEA